MSYLSSYPGSTIRIYPGDMLVTKSTSYSGLTGHAGIVVDCRGYVASIAGTGAHPKLMSIPDWFNKYKTERVVRYNDSKAAGYAANWANWYVSAHSDADYGFNALSDFNVTYCSKIVWDAYYYGAQIRFRDLSPNAATLFQPYFIDDLANTKIVYANW